MQPSQRDPVAPGRAVLLVVGMVAVLGGVTALGQQMLWTRRMVDLMGGTSESSSRVFGAFFLGLALGAAGAARYGGRVARPWRMLAWIEVGVLVTALTFVALPPAVERLWAWLGPDRAFGWQGASLKTLVSLLAVMPPAFLMGWFLPLAVRGLRWGPRVFKRGGLVLYGANTAGGVLGLVGLSLLLIERVGTMGSFLCLMVLHAGVFCLLIILDRLDPAEGTAGSEEGDAEADVDAKMDAATDAGAAGGQWSAGVLLGLAFFSGFAILATEVVMLKIVLLVAPLSFHAPAVVLSVVILLLAVGAFAAIPLVRWKGALVVALAAAGVATALAALVFYGLAKWSGGMPPMESFGAFWWRLWVLCSLAFGPGLLFGGLVFPLLSAAWSRVVGGPGGGHRWGWLLAVNGLGGFLGAECALRVLLPWAGLYGALGWVAIGYAAVALALAWRMGDAAGLRRMAVAALGGCVALAVLLPARLPTINPSLRAVVLWERSGPDGTVAVVERADGDRAILISNQYFLGSRSAEPSQKRQGHLPLLLHPRPESVAFLGVATGMTPAAALEQGAPASITAFEISRSVLEVAEAFFAVENNALHRDPRVRLVREDARLGVLASPGAFDVVIGDLFLPWGPGEARLFSVEHFAAVRRSLKPDGLFVQWLPLYQLREAHLATILAGFEAVFPEVHGFLGKLETGQPILALAGWEAGGGPDWASVSDRIAAERERLRDPALRHVEGLRMLYLGDLSGRSGGARPNTLATAELELRASRDRIVAEVDQGYLTGPRFLAWLDQLTPPPAFYASRQLLNWQQINPRQPTLSEGAARWLPAAIITDPEADWQFWPGPPPAH